MVYRYRVIQTAMICRMSRQIKTNSCHSFTKSSQPPNLHIFSVQPRSIRSSCLVTRAQPPTSSSLRMTDRSLWNQLPSSLHQPHSIPSVSNFPVYVPDTFSHSVNSSLSPSISQSLFHFWLKTYLFHK